MIKRLSLDKGQKKKNCKRELIDRRYMNSWSISNNWIENGPILQAMFMQELKDIVLPNYPLVLSLLKHRDVWVFWNKKNPVQTSAAP